ncbi:MAG: hypothetical protein AB7J32_03180 [Pseudonocardia sp.]
MTSEGPVHEHLRFDGSPYANKYKEKTAEHTAAADRLREEDRRRAVELGKRLVELEEARERAARSAAVSRAVVELHWEAALEALWAESWLKLLPKPKAVADPEATPLDRLDDELARLAHLDEELARRSEALHVALHRSRWSLPRRRG